MNTCCHVRFGSKADICAAIRHVRFTPDNDRESGFPHKVMSALPPKADIGKKPVGYSPEPTTGKATRGTEHDLFPGGLLNPVIEK
jgi:hypothetical protein